MFEGRSGGTALRFHLIEAPAKVAFTIHSFARSSGQHTFKATCHVHKTCVCWITKAVDGEERNKLLLGLVGWGSSCRSCDENEHWRQSVALKRAYGMKVRVG